MQVNKVLFLPSLKKMEQELLDLFESARIHGSRQSLGFAGDVEKKLSEIRSVCNTLSHPSLDSTVSASEEWRKTYRQIKLDLRFARRQWGRILSNESRFRKLKEKESVEHAPSFAA